MWMQFPLEDEFIHLITEHTLLFTGGALIQLVFFVLAMIFRVMSQQAAKKAERQAHYINLVFTMAPFEIIHLDNDGLIKRINVAGAQFLGYSEEELISKSFISMFVCGIDIPKIEKLLMDCAGQHIQNCEVRISITRRSGEKAELACYVAPFWSGDDPDGFILFARDITLERKIAHWREQGRHFEAVQLFAHGIIHDFNNVVQVVLGKAELALMDVMVGPTVRLEQSLQDIMKQGRHAAQMINTLWELTKERVDKKYPIPFKSLVEEVCASEITRSSYKINMPLGLWVVWGDIEAIRQVFIQLCQNADQAIPESRVGDISVNFENVWSKDISGWMLPEGHYVKVQVSDNGMGIPAEFLDRIFDPYVTTKISGSGLGLAMVHSIVTKHGGHIVIDSEMGIGTTFNVYLPAVTFECEGQNVFAGQRKE